MDGRREEVLLRGDAHLRLQARRVHRRRARHLANATQTAREPRLQELRLVPPDDHTGSYAAADGRRVLRRDHEPADSRVLRGDARLLHRGNVHVLRAQDHSAQQLRTDAHRRVASEQPVRADRRRHADAACARVSAAGGGGGRCGQAARQSPAGGRLEPEEPRPHVGPAAGIGAPAGRHDARLVRDAGDERRHAAPTRPDAAAGAVRREERLPAVVVHLQVLLRPGAGRHHASVTAAARRLLDIARVNGS